ncbi:DUF4270 family protein [Pedobacter sp. LMG 31464]|uniref:DUF4270 family protein n=1 Tax=Pedobacter planticolens TaxID=2679964 RepID=A0A923E0F0_9SPHI|nr:DUF4270 domain-containing protein [Pedobacter planticolens]MBB2146426.1 DUF4270 family protein [Pedobacter planticolens]
MKFSKLDLLTLLISLFLFASCENTSTIGLEVDPSSAIQGSLIDSVTIMSRTIKEDETSTVSAVRHPLGYMKDAIFGTTESSLAMAVNLPNDAYDFGTTPAIDSAVLVLNYGGEFYGDSTATYSIDVHPLNVNISKETSFLSNKDWSYNSQLLGNKTGKLYPTTKYKVTDIVDKKADTLRTVTPQIRIPLDKTYIQNNIANLSATNLKNNSNFTQVFNGLHVQINKTSSTGNGGLAFFEFSGTTSALVLYYKKQNATTATLKDTVSINFPILNATGPIAATIKHDYTGTPVGAQLLSNSTVQQPVTYLQPLVGLRNKITFPYLSKFATNIGKIVINKAELVIDVSTGTDVLPYGAAPRLSLYRYDIAEQRQNVPDNNLSSQVNSGDPRALSPTVFGGYYNSLTKQYVFVVTSYIQDLLNGKTKDYGTFLAPTPTNEYQISPSISTGARAVIGSFKKTPAAGDNLMKLNIYYTKIN